MYETVKIVNGFEIKRRRGTRGFYYVDIRIGEHFKEYRSFRTVKAAVDFCESYN